jgi:hypothetical protein
VVGDLFVGQIGTRNTLPGNTLAGRRVVSMLSEEGHKPLSGAVSYNNPQI